MSDTFTPKPGRLMDQVRETLRFYHYSYSAEKNYVQWILRYIGLTTVNTQKTWAKRKLSVS